MKKHFKSIAAAITMAGRMVTFCVPVMAAEQVPDVEVSNQNVEDSEEVASARALVGEFHYTGRLTKNKVLGTVYIDKSSKTLQYTVGRTGSDGLVNLQLTNTSTGEVRSFSTVADNTLRTTGWVTPLSPGGWEVKVIFVESSSLYDVDLYFAG